MSSTAARRASSWPRWSTPAEVPEDWPALDLLWRARFRWQLWPRQATGDKAYGTLDLIRALEDQGVRAYMPLPDFGQPHRPTSASAPSPTTRPTTPTLCPQGHTAAVRPPPQVRSACSSITPTPPRATPARSRRAAPPSTRAAWSAAATTRSISTGCAPTRQTEAYQKALRKRSVWVEPLFAEAKDWHGLRRFRLRRLWRVNSRSAADGERPEPQAAAQSARLGPPPVPRRRAGPPDRVSACRPYCLSAENPRPILIAASPPRAIQTSRR